MSHTILLVSVNRCSFPYPVFPLGLSHLAAALQAEGFETLLHDLLADTTALGEVIRRVKPDFIGLSLRNIDDIQIHNTGFYAPSLVSAAREARESTGVPLILGGSGYSLFPQTLLEGCGADFGICGEAEASLPALLRCLIAGADPSSLPGLVFRKGSDIVCNPKQPCAVSAIRPAQRPASLAGYYITHSSMLNIQTQRGCPYRCCYCTYPLIEGACVRYRSAESVCDDVARAAASGASYVAIVDSVFNTSPDHVAAVCEELIRRKNAVRWSCYMRPRGVSRPLLELMARAGLAHIEFGTDSLCDSVLEAYGKEFTFDDVLAASECARRAGVHYAHFLITGGPGETEETIACGFNNAARLKRTVFFSYIGMRLYPHTPLYDIALKEGAVSAETDLLPPFFYVTPQVSRDRIAALLAECHRRMKNWLVGESTPELVKILGDLRGIGVAGPLWEFMVR